MVDEVKKTNPTGLFVNVALPSGETKSYTMEEANVLGFNTGNINNDMPRYYYYKDPFGNDAYTTDVADLPAFISLNESTGNIEITAPEEITSTDMFKQAFSEDRLKEYSLAYKINPDYKITITDRNEETGEDEEKEVTIPEYVAKLNDSMQLYMKDIRSLHAYRTQLAKEYGDKANNMTDAQVQMAFRTDGTSIYLPDTLFNVGSFGDKRRNLFAPLRDKRTADGAISLDDFAKVYTRENIGRDEMAAILAHINGTLKGSNWAKEDTYTDEDGEEIKNPNSATEMAKLLAFKNYILSNNPYSEWWQQAGDTIESFVSNAAYGVTRVFANLANVGQTVVTLGNGREVQETIESMDEAMEYFNSNNALVWDAVANAQILGYLGGTALGATGVSFVRKAAVGGLSKIAAGTNVKLGAESAAALEAAGLATAAETATAGMTMAESVSMLYSLAMGAEAISTGTKIMLASLNAVEKVSMFTNVAITGISGVANKNIFTQFLFDTVHDAMLYDSTTLRNVLTELAKDPNDANKSAALRYWGEQLLDNAKWWGVITLLKGAKNLNKVLKNKTSLGYSANVVLTKYLSKARAVVGTRIQNIRDNLANGTVIAKLEKQLSEIEDMSSPKAQRLQERLNQELVKAELRTALGDLGDVKLEWDGVKLSEDSIKEFRKFETQVRSYEQALSSRLNAVKAVERQMDGLVKDPSTGKLGYVNPTLGGAFSAAESSYYDVADTISKYGIKATDSHLWGNDATKYFMASQHYKIMAAIADAKGENAARAAEAAKILSENISLAKTRLPAEVVLKLDELLETQSFQKYYAALNEYGVAHSLLEKERIKSYEANPIWAENGYIPMVLQTERKGRWLSDTGRIDATIAQDFEQFTYKVASDQEYVDPMLVLLSRRREMADAQISKQLWDAYNTSGSSATNITVVSGEETAYAKQVSDVMKKLRSQAEVQSKKAFEESLMLGIPQTKRRKATKNVEIATEDQAVIVEAMSPSEVTDYLAKRGPLPKHSSKLTDGVTVENYDSWFDGRMNGSAKKYIRQQAGSGNGRPDYSTFAKMVQDGGDDFEEGLERAYLMGDKTFAKSSYANEAARNLAAGRDAFYQGTVVARVKGELRGVLTLDVDSFVDEAFEELNGQIETFVDVTMKNSGLKQAMAALSEDTDGAQALARYTVLRELAAKDNIKNVKEAVSGNVDKLLSAGKYKFKGDDERVIKKKLEELAVDTIQSKLSEASVVAKAINPDAVDVKSIYDQVVELNSKIRAAESRVGTDYVMYLDKEGRKAYAQVDPAFASLYSYREKLTRGEASLLAKTNALMSKAFRWGTTAVNLSSFGNQLFRDFGNAILVGGAWDTIKANADNLVNVFGQSIVDQIKIFDPEGYEERQLALAAEQSGQSLEQAAVSRELRRGAAMAPSSTEVSLYKNLRKQMKAASADSLLEGGKNKLQELVDKYSLDDLLNGKRENYLRNRVYASALNDALTEGYTLQQARTYAEFAMTNATTNFAQKLYHMQAIADSTPYFSAAINGTKSFWRMWALDPVGVSGRIVGGLILPTMALTGASLSNEEDKKVYMNIPEYSKADSLVFVFDGNAMSIPLPQELSSVVAPFRQFVEYLHGANKNDFWELMMNDLLGFSPVDLQGFSTIDMDKMISDPTFFDRVNRGVSRVFSQIAPVPVRSAYMLATGTDPYTGKSLRDSSYMYWNDETGSLEVMTYDQNSFAKWFASLFGDEMTPELAEKIVSGIIGTTGSNLLGDLTALIQEGPEAAFQSLGSNVVESLMKPVTVSEYDLVDSIWKRAVRQLTTEKEALLSSDKMKALNSELAQTTDTSKQKKLLAERQTLTDEFQQKVGDMVKRLTDVYEGSFDRKKVAAVLNLLNMNSDPGYIRGSQYSINIANEQFWDGRDAAVRTMAELGISGATDTSIFGYLSTDSSGNPVVKYSSPIAIMDMESQWKNQDDINAANIKAIIAQNDLYEKHKAVSDQISAIYGSKSKLTNQDYANIEAIQINWNAELAKTLAPYIAKMTPEAAINNTEVKNLLYSYVEVPSSWETKNGKYVSLGDRGNKKKAFYDSWIKTLFGVNDPYKGQY